MARALDATGKQVLMTTFEGTTTIDVSGLERGLYCIQTIIDGKIQITEILVEDNFE
ncbi:MAG: T9SS type A sorting domain-containing protein [Cytophagales bacterium]|nr:T9SS type A sorting domain-containing protein [Cytophagales bacterium]MDW8384304.1 T9SS type A sorting domain-containing protein [Flammeovirgaceae bacterium]